MADLAFAPDYVVSPGEILEETLDANGIAKGDFARRIGISMKTLSLILAGKAPVSPETALQMEQVLGVSAQLWCNLEANYRLALARKEARANDEKIAEWATQFPVAELKLRGMIAPTVKGSELAKAVLSFFNVASTDTWEELYGSTCAAAAFRRSTVTPKKLYKQTTWFRLAQIAAEGAATEPFDKRKFAQVVKNARTMTRDAPAVFMEPLKTACAEAGVALLIIPAIPGCGVYGVTSWLSKGKAFLALSNLRKSDDQFWFTFFHEAGHILLHGKDCSFFEEKDMEQTDQEKEADAFARSALFPAGIYDEFKRNGKFYHDDILAFATRSGVAPGIVTGFLQHDGMIKTAWHNGFKVGFDLEAFT